MKIVDRYCDKCKKITRHIKEKETTGFERVFGAIVTVGFAELCNDTNYMCTKCEKKTTTSNV